jgi:hypothetical protein
MLTPVLAPGPHFLERQLQLLVCHAALVLARLPAPLRDAGAPGGLRPTASVVELDALWARLGASLLIAARRLPTFVLFAPAVLEMAHDFYRGAQSKRDLLLPAALVVGLFGWLALGLVVSAGLVAHRAARRALRARRRARQPAGAHAVAGAAAAAPTWAAQEETLRMAAAAGSKSADGTQKLAPAPSI